MKIKQNTYNPLGKLDSLPRCYRQASASLVTLTSLVSLLVLLALPTSPAHAGNLKVLLAPASLGVVSSDILNRRLPTGFKSIADFGLALELGTHAHAFALDYYAVGATYEYSDRRRDVSTKGLRRYDFKDDLAVNAIHVGYRTHSKRGVYFGLGAMLLDPSVERERSLSEREELEEDEDREPIPQNFDFESVWAPAITFGYDYSFKGGFTFGGHIVTSFAVDSKDKNSDAVLDNLTMASLSLAIGFDW